MKFQGSMWSRMAATVAVLCGVAAPASANVFATANPAANWLGYMNVFNLPVGSGGYVFGSPWGTADLAASFNVSTLRLSPNTNTYNAGDAFWVQPNGDGNKWMNANYYVEDTGLLGQTLTFSAQCVLNNLAQGYTSRAFIKILDSNNGYSTVSEVYAPLVTGQTFSLSLPIPNTPGFIPQYGFVTDGANANPATVIGLGQALIVPVPEPTSLALLALGGLMLTRRR